MQHLLGGADAEGKRWDCMLHDNACCRQVSSSGLPRINAEQYGDMWTARGRLKGALLEALDPTADDSDESSHYSPRKKDRDSVDGRNDENDESSDERHKKSHISPPRQPYVLKLFDRSVDLSQFDEDSPLYPICRAWILNQPKANYRQLCKKKEEYEEGFIVLPGPEGPPAPRTPPLLPEQISANKNNINLNYKENPPMAKEQLLAQHAQRWAAVRRAWRDQAALVEARYATSRDVIFNMKTS